MFKLVIHKNNEIDYKILHKDHQKLSINLKHCEIWYVSVAVVSYASNIMENYPSPYIMKDTKDTHTGADDFSDSAGCSSASSTETLKPEEHQENIVVSHATVDCHVECSRNRVKSIEDGYFSHESDFARTKLNPGVGENLRAPDGANHQLNRVESNVSIVSVDMSTCPTITSARSPVPHEFVTSGSLQTLGEKSSSCGEILGSRSSLSKRSLKGKVFFSFYKQLGVKTDLSVLL